MKRKKIFPLTVAELEALPTKQLLARLTRLHQCEQSLALSDQDSNDYDTSGSIEFKESAEWTTAYDQLKRVLARREHIGATARSK
jgi:hypothetical protein